MLSVALVAPRLVDWSAHRDGIAGQLGAITGGEVTLTGPVSLELLPTPYLSLGRGSVMSRGPDGARLDFASARLELALAKLAGGNFRFTEIRLEKPELALNRGPDGAPMLPSIPSSRANSIGFDRLVVANGRIRLAADAGKPALDINAVGLEGDAPALSGPFRVSGRFAGPGGAPIVFRAASEKAEGAGTPLRLSIDAGSGWPAIEFDGALEGRALAGTATFIGSAPGDGAAAMPWRAKGELRADSAGASLKPAEFRLGPDERAISGEGSAALAFGSPVRLSLDVKAKQANADGLMRRKDENATPPARTFAALMNALTPALQGDRRIALDASLTTGQLILGGETLSPVSARLSATPGRPPVARIDIGLPGDTRLHADGRIETGPAAAFIGTVDFASDSLPQLRDWASQGAPGFDARIAAAVDALPYRRAALKGDIEASAVSASGRDLTLMLGDSMLHGALAVTAAVGAEPGRLFIDMTTDSLDIAAPNDPSASMGALASLDLSLTLAANRLHVARLDGVDIESGSLALKVTKSGQNLRLERLSVADLGGATLEAQGVSGPDGLSANGRLTAERLRDFTALVANVFPSDAARWLMARADALSPAALAFSARGADTPSAALAVDGTVGTTHVALSADPGPNGRGRAGALTMDSDDAGTLLRQLGIPVRGALSGRAHVALTASGSADGTYDGDGLAALAGVDLYGRGRFVPAATSDQAKLFGSAKLKSANVGPLLAALGLGGSGVVVGPVDGGADLTLRGDRWTVSRLAGSVAGVKASGSFTVSPTAPAAAIPELSAATEAIGGAKAGPVISGALSLDRLPASALFSLALGAPSAPKPPLRWSEAKFAPAPVTPPPTEIDLTIGALDLADGLVAQRFAARLGLDGGRLDLDGLGFQLMGGAVSGHATLRRNGDSATLTGALSGNDLSVARVGVAGRFGATVDFASTGRSPAMLIDGLAGEGTAKLATVTFPRSDPGALDRTVATAQDPEAPLDETNVAFSFGAALDRGALTLPDGSAPLALNAGAIKLGPLAIPHASGSALFSATLDLRRMTMETRLQLSSPADKLMFWSGPPPGAVVTVADALDGAPRRKLDVSALSAGLATQAIARESERIANLEADIRERAAFNRRLKGERFLQQRDQEIQDFGVEQARLKGLAQRLDAERATEEADKAAARKAAEAKAAAQRAADAEAASKAAADKAAADKTIQIELPPDIPASSREPAKSPAARSDASGADALGIATPLPPPRPAPVPQPTAGGLY